MSWSDEQETPSQSLQEQINSPLTSQLVVENSQLYALLEESKKLIEEQRKNWEEQRKHNGATAALLNENIPKFREHVAGIHEALPCEISKQIKEIYSHTEQATEQSARRFQQALDQNLERIEESNRYFAEELKAATSRNQAEAEKAADQLQEITRRAKVHSRIREWIITGLLSVVFVFAILAFGSVIVDGGAFEAIDQGAKSIGGTGGTVFAIALKWVLPIVAIGGTIWWVNRDSYRR